MASSIDRIISKGKVVIDKLTEKIIACSNQYIPENETAICSRGFLHCIENTFIDTPFAFWICVYSRRHILIMNANNVDFCHTNTQYRVINM